MRTQRLFSLSGCLFAIVVGLAAMAVPCARVEAKKIAVEPRRFTFKIDPATPLKDLLPVPPKAPVKLPPYLNEDLWEVPELTFGEPVAHDSDTEKETAHILARINHLNRKDPDGFLKALVANRGDLRGLPFLMDKDCRTEVQKAQVFAQIVAAAHRLRGDVIHNEQGAPKPISPVQYWRDFKGILDDPRKSAAISNLKKATSREKQEMAVMAIMQIFGPESEAHRVGLAQYLTSVEHIDATQALAKLAVFASEEAVRKAAIDGLKKRPSKDGYAKILMQGIRYPLPVASTRAADALVALKCHDVLADLVNVLVEPDPRAPRKQTIDGKEVTAVRELVRVNHHRNCLLCHAPANTEGVPRDVLTAPVPLPNEALSTSPGGYGRDASPDIFIRTDITYLRQDFSLMMRVEKANPWPEMQRFDFFVRTRVVTPEEAAECEKQLARQGTPPSHIAARHALRELTGQSPAENTPQAWRRVLNLQGKQ